MDLTVRGLGISCAPLRSVERRLADRSLQRLLPDWSVPLEPMFAYHPGKRQPTAAPRVFLKHLRQVDAWAPMGQAAAKRSLMPDARAARPTREGVDTLETGRRLPRP